MNIYQYTAETIANKGTDTNKSATTEKLGIATKTTVKHGNKLYVEIRFDKK